MALEVMKATAYQNSVSPATKTSDAGGPTSIDMGFETLRNQPVQRIQPEVEQDGDNREAPAASQQHIKAEISKANNRLKRHNTKCEFSYHEETKRVTITVRDKDTEEIIREIPPEKTLEMIEKMWELAGFLIDEKR
jgi:flagellar protein FlaG